MADNQTQTLTFDGKIYPIDSLSDQAKAQVSSLRITDQEIARLQAQLNIFQTARAAYARALKQALEQTPAISN